MTSKIIELSTARKSAKKSVKAIVKKPLSNHEIFWNVYAEILDDWQRFAAKNSLNAYINKKLPPHLRAFETDFVNDLNAIVNLEQKLQMRVAVFSPECTKDNPYGWLVGFHRGGRIQRTEPCGLERLGHRD